MKGKKFTYLLIACVGLVWTLIFYRIYAGLADDDPVPVATVNIPKQQIKFVDHRNDRYRLALDYPDPFNRTFQAEAPEPVAAARSNNPVQPAVPARPIVQPVDWSVIRYTGFINNATTKARLAMMQINGVEQTLRVGDQFGGLKLLKNQGDSVLVSYKNKTRFIRMNMSGAPNASL